MKRPMRCRHFRRSTIRFGALIVVVTFFRPRSSSCCRLRTFGRFTLNPFFVFFFFFSRLRIPTIHTRGKRVDVTQNQTPCRLSREPEPLRSTTLSWFSTIFRISRLSNEIPEKSFRFNEGRLFTFRSEPSSRTTIVSKDQCNSFITCCTLGNDLVADTIVPSSQK